MSTYLFEESDEFSHRPTKDENFNESVYVNGFEVDRGIGGWMRIGNRPNEKHAEVQLCFYLTDGRLACQFLRPQLSGNTDFASGGLAYRVVTPSKEVEMSYEGEVLLVDNPELLRSPASLFKDAPRAPASILYRLTATSPVHGGIPASASQETMYGRNFSYGHFFQQMETVASIDIGDESWQFAGGGWRDHSWGPRFWTNIYYYRLYIANFGPDRGMTLLKITDRDGKTRREGVLQYDGDYEPVTDLDIITEWTQSKDPRYIEMNVQTPNRRVRMSGDVMLVAPLRNKRTVGRELLESRISEGLTEWRWEGRKGIGITEYIEFLENGEPVGYPL